MSEAKDSLVFQYTGKDTGEIYETLEIMNAKTSSGEDIRRTVRYVMKDLVLRAGSTALPEEIMVALVYTEPTTTD
jgi:hypothetical protein